MPGDKGDEGPPGEPGAEGNPGLKGEQGPQGKGSAAGQSMLHLVLPTTIDTRVGKFSPLSPCSMLFED